MYALLHSGKGWLTGYADDTPSVPGLRTMTSDGESLFRAVCANAGDDTPRLIYADWLEENGQQERAELIRLQCEASHQSPAFPSEIGRRNRASKLLREFGDRWYSELPQLKGVDWGSLFVRGFIDTARTRAIRDITRTLDTVFAAVPLIFLTVSSLQPGQLGELLAHPLLGRLRRLHLAGTVGREEARVLAEARERFPNTQII
jgi:uncharacterized protein (TIGR02996 family)